MNFDQEYKDLLAELDSLSGEELKSELDWWVQAIHPKNEGGWIEHFGTETIPDFWDYFDYRERYRTYNLDYFLEALECAEDDIKQGHSWVPEYEGQQITQEHIDHYRRELIRKNLGSMIFDW